ncbi:MAG: Flp pilus assembly protein CpaB [Elusimicrobiota bacterium]
MDKKKALIIAAVLGLVVVILVAMYMGGIEEQYVSRGETQAVVVTREHIPPYTVLEESMVKIEQVPKEYIQPAALTSMDDLVDDDGRYVYTSVAPINREEQVITTKLAAIGREAGLAMSLPQGKRAVAINVGPETGVGMHIQPGNYVDVMGTFDYRVEDSGGAEQKLKTKVMLQNVLVVAVRESIFGEHPEARQQAEEMGMRAGGGGAGNTITLAVSPQEAVLLSFARQRGDMAFSLRAIGDEEEVELEDANYKTLFPEEERKVVNTQDQQPQDLAKEILGDDPDVGVIRGIQDAIQQQIR